MDIFLAGPIWQTCQIWSGARHGVSRNREPGWVKGALAIWSKAFEIQGVPRTQWLEIGARQTAARILPLQYKGLRLPFVSGRLQKPDSSLSRRSR